MNQENPPMAEHHENEELTASGEPISPEFANETGDVAEGQSTDGMQKLHAELAETRDKFLRIYSEFDNYKKRTQRERVDLLKSASSEIVISLLPVLDDFDRALKSIDSRNTESGVREGMELIFHKMKGVLENKGLKRMISVGEDFNVDLHEAITNIPAPDPSMVGKVVDEAESGYFLNDKVIRHAKVIVGI